MVATQGVIAKGMSFKVGDGGTPTEVFTAIADVTSIKISGRQADEIEFTHLLSDMKEFKPGFVDPGSIALSLQFNPAIATHDSATGVESWLASGAMKNFKVVFPSTVGKTLSGVGFVKSNEISGEASGKITGECTFRLSGLTTWGDSA
ncbi:phage tail tube protein [Pleomorphomonas sp. PLEO]|uniref:phage tail tube protein n=1 Tax=Pleomorphomonas sp. PLEO TaxID=3239306 RepID=UPI00351E81A8